jgi:hypothetical protein
MITSVNELRDCTLMGWSDLLAYAAIEPSTNLLSGKSGIVGHRFNICNAGIADGL